MSTRQDSAPAPTVRSREDLIAWIAAGSKPAHAWRIGTEHEKFLFYTDTLQPVPYAGARGVRAVTVVGGDERARGQVSIKDMKTGQQSTLGRDGIAAALQVLIAGS